VIPAAPPAAARCSSPKRGLSYDFQSQNDLAALKGISWFYNWSPKPNIAVPSNIEFVPMIWGSKDLTASAIASIPAGSKYLLGFNEPNFHVQGNLSPQQAAQLWPQVEQIASSKGLKLVSPAINYCGPTNDCWNTNPFDWLDQFFAACNGCLNRMDYIAAHWYACGATAQAPYLQNYLAGFQKYNKKIWLTEWSCGDDSNLQSPSQQAQYMKQVIDLIENSDQIFRYAWFSGRTPYIPNVDTFGADGQLTSPVGTTYNTYLLTCNQRVEGDNGDSSSDGGAPLPAGAIAGIVIGSLAVAIVVAALAFVVLRKNPDGETV
jgi:hypothetical protein